MNTNLFIILISIFLISESQISSDPDCKGDEWCSLCGKEKGSRGEIGGARSWNTSGWRCQWKHLRAPTPSFIAMSWENHGRWWHINGNSWENCWEFLCCVVLKWQISFSSPSLIVKLVLYQKPAFVSVSSLFGTFCSLKWGDFSQLGRHKNPFYNAIYKITSP